MGMGYFSSVCTKPIWWFHLIEACAIWSSSHVWQLNMLEFVFGWVRIIFFKPFFWTTCGDVGAVWQLFRLSDSKTQLISAILHLWSLESLWPSKSPLHCALGRYRHASSSRKICNIFSWLEPLYYCPDGGNRDFQCFRSFLTPCFVILNNLVLHIRTIFLVFSPGDGWLRVFGHCVPHI